MYDVPFQIRDFFLAKERELQEALRLKREQQREVRSVNYIPRISKKRKGLLLLEERRRKLMALFASPEHQKRMAHVLDKINHRFAVQSMFPAFLQQSEPRLNTVDFH